MKSVLPTHEALDAGAGCPRKAIFCDGHHILTLGTGLFFNSQEETKLRKSGGVMLRYWHWLEHDSVALTALLAGISLVGLLVWSI